MRDEIIEILEMISPGISVENNNLNLVEYLESMEMIEFIEELENNFDIEIPSEDRRKFWKYWVNNGNDSETSINL